MIFLSNAPAECDENMMATVEFSNWEFLKYTYISAVSDWLPQMYKNLIVYQDSFP